MLSRFVRPAVSGAFPEDFVTFLLTDKSYHKPPPV